MFASLSHGAVDGVFIASLNLRVKFHSLILRLASEQHLPVAGHRKEWVEQGALFSYAESIREVGRAAAGRYVDKILKGAKPADLPIEASPRARDQPQDRQDPRPYDPAGAYPEGGPGDRVVRGHSHASNADPDRGG